jgi:hypothetical protein
VRQETAALRDLDPAHVRNGSIASDIIVRIQRPMSALPQKQTNGQTSRQVSFVPIATVRSAAKSVLIRSPRRGGEAASRLPSAMMFARCLAYCCSSVEDRCSHYPGSGNALIAIASNALSQ